MKKLQVAAAVVLFFVLVAVGISAALSMRYKVVPAVGSNGIVYVLDTWAGKFRFLASDRVGEIRPAVVHD